MVQDETADTDPGIRVAQGLKKIPASPINLRRQAAGAGHQIKTGHTRERQGGMHLPAKPALASADFNNSSRTGNSILQLAHDPSRITEEKINPPQIPAAPDSARIRRRQGIQNLGSNYSKQLAHVLRVPAVHSPSQPGEFFAGGEEGFLPFGEVEADVAVLGFTEKARAWHPSDADFFD